MKRKRVEQREDIFQQPPRFPYSPSTNGPRRHSSVANIHYNHNGLASPPMYNVNQSRTPPPWHHNGHNIHRTIQQQHSGNPQHRNKHKRPKSPVNSNHIDLNTKNKDKKPIQKQEAKINVDQETNKRKDKVDKQANDTDEEVLVVAVIPGESNPKKKRKVTESREIIDLEDDSVPSSSGTTETKTPSSTLPKKYLDHLTSAILGFYDRNVQSKMTFEKKIILRDGVQKIISNTFQEGLLHLTGSSMSGFGTKNSDADMALIFNPRLPDIGKKKARNVINRLASKLRNQGFARNVEMVFAKVPIIKFHDQISNCDVDININNIVGIKNSFLLRSISLLDKRIPALVIVIKAWAKSHDINSAYQGSLSSYLIVNLILYYLQRGVSPPILPPLQPHVDELQAVNVNTELQRFVPANFIDYTTENKDELGSLFVDFFKFWNKKFLENKIYCTYTSSETIRTYNTPYLDNNTYVLCIKEPFQKDNIARAVRPKEFDDVKYFFKSMEEHFSEITEFADLFGECNQKMTWK